MTLGLKRYGMDKLKTVTVTRGEIPQKSINATYMMDKHTGYIKIKNFGENTYAELLIALATLSQETFDNLIIDLRGNTGGYLASAVQIANEHYEAIEKAVKELSRQGLEVKIVK